MYSLIPCLLNSCSHDHSLTRRRLKAGIPLNKRTKAAWLTSFFCSCSVTLIPQYSSAFSVISRSFSGLARRLSTSRRIPIVPCSSSESHASEAVSFVSTSSKPIFSSACSSTHSRYLGQKPAFDRQTLRRIVYA